MEDEKKTKKQLIEELNALRLEKSEQTRVTSEKFTKAFLQNSIPTIITSVKDSSVVEVSDAFLRLVGLKRHEIIGHTAVEGGFITKEQRVTFFNELNKNGRIENLEMEVNPKGKGLRYGLFNSVMISISNENCALTTIQDITERKQAEAALKLSNERLVEAQKIAMIGDWEANLLTDELYWSQVIFDIFALDSKSFKPSVTTFYNAVHPDDRGLVLESEERSEQTGLHDVVHRIIRPNGEIRFVHELARRYKDNQGKLIKLRGTVQDITKRKQAEDALKEERSRLQQALDEVRTLRGIFPICTNCKKIRDDKGFWNQVEKYVSERTEAEFSHGICPECAQKVYPDISTKNKIKVTGRPVILLVDDEEDFRMIFIRQIKQILKDQEFEFIEASDGEEALELLKGGAMPSIIILDYAMPKINGMELLKRIDGDHNDLYDVPRIMISGYTQKEIIREAQTLRCVFFEKSMDNIFYQQIFQYMTNILVDLAHKKGGVNK